MTKFRLLTTILFCCACGTLAGAPPNVILIIADDLGYGDVGCYGSEHIRTPHIDALAAEGVRFTDGYVAAAVCSPSRAGLITGRYPQRHGFEFNIAGRDDLHGLALSERTIADVMQSAGYATGAIGKWHLGKSAEQHPQSRGFDEYFGMLEGGSTYVTLRTPEAVAINSLGQESRVRERPNKILRDRTVVEEDEYLTDAFTREALDFINRHREEPFFLYLSYNAPHTPLQAKRTDVEAYSHIEDVKTRVFAAMVKSLDDGVGQVTAKLEELGLQENTLVAFISDNGGALYVGGASSNGSLNGGKRYQYEGGVRVPFIMKWPARLPAGQVDSRPVISLDLLPTFAAAAGAEAGKGIDGVDLMPYLTTEKQGSPHERLFWRAAPNLAVRKGRWKLWLVNRATPGLETQLQPGSDRLPRQDWPVSSPRGQVELLFDLSKDEEERRNLAEERPEIVRELREEIDKWDVQLATPQWPCNRSKVFELDGEWLQLFF